MLHRAGACQPAAEGDAYQRGAAPPVRAGAAGAGVPAEAGGPLVLAVLAVAGPAQRGGGVAGGEGDARRVRAGDASQGGARARRAWHHALPREHHDVLERGVGRTNSPFRPMHVHVRFQAGVPWRLIHDFANIRQQTSDSRGNKEATKMFSFSCVARAAPTYNAVSLGRRNSRSIPSRLGSRPALEPKLRTPELVQCRGAASLQVNCAGFGAAIKPKKGKQGGKKAADIPDACPCGRQKSYADCCGRYHTQADAVEPDAETVMRARFSAYVKREFDYIVRTTHPDNPDLNRQDTPEASREQLLKDVDQTCKTTKFLKLTIVNTADSTDNEAYVTFRATFQQGKWSEKARMLNERSRFLKEDGRWLYRAAFPLNENTL
eukprot:1190489-Prorocentrum_minimum.AAC.4